MILFFSYFRLKLYVVRFYLIRWPASCKIWFLFSFFLVCMCFEIRLLFWRNISDSLKLYVCLVLPFVWAILVSMYRGSELEFDMRRFKPYRNWLACLLVRIRVVQQLCLVYLSSTNRNVMDTCKRTIMVYE